MTPKLNAQLNAQLPGLETPERPDCQQRVRYVGAGPAACMNKASCLVALTIGVQLWVCTTHFRMLERSSIVSARERLP